MSRFDPHSWCDGDQPRQRHLDLDLTVDFTARTLAGTARIHLRGASEGPLDLDSTDSGLGGLELEDSSGSLALDLVEEPIDADPLAPSTTGAYDRDALDPLVGVEERRTAERTAARLPVHVDANHISLDGRTRDISEKGVLLSADASDLPIGKQVTLSLTHPNTGERLTIEGTVARHVTTHGTVGAVGIAFEEGPDGGD